MEKMLAAVLQLCHVTLGKATVAVMMTVLMISPVDRAWTNPVTSGTATIIVVPVSLLLIVPFVKQLAILA